MREAVRLRAAGWFAEGVPVPEIARRLRVSQTAAYGWRQRWRRGGEQALASKGPGGARCRLDDARLRRLADALDEGPAVHGFGEDQRWTLARVSDLIAANGRRGRCGWNHGAHDNPTHLLKRQGGVRSKRGLVKRIIKLLACGGLAGLVTAGILFPFAATSGLVAKTGAEVRVDLPPELLKKRAPQASEVYAADGTTLISRFLNDDRRDVALADVSELMRTAILAAEDQAFYTHHGVDGRAVLRSFVSNWAGNPRQGGSTLTMQYVRLAITYSATDPADIVRATENTKGRKIREVGLAQELERRLSKDEILEGYLNMAPFGNNTYGVYAASRQYFAKRPADLTIPEAATLAAIVKGPSDYNPYTPEGAAAVVERRNWVIDQMVAMKANEAGTIKAISREQADAAKATPLTIKQPPRRTDCTQADPNHWGFFCDYFLRWWNAQEAFGATPAERERRLKEGGYRVVTSLDPAVQNAAHTRVEKHLPTGKRDALMLAAIEPGTGRVRALATNRVFGVTDPAQPNPVSSNPQKAAQGHRASYPRTSNPLMTGGGDIKGYQAGSTFKIFTLVAALEQGVPLAQTIDAKARYESRYSASGSAACPGTNRYCPTNSNRSMAGVHDAWSAFGNSVNTFFVPLQEQVGAAKVVDVARRLGIEFRDPDERAMADDPAKADGWGAFTLGVTATTPLDLANAYATLAADGKRCQPIPVQEIKGPDGHAIAAANPRCEQKVAPDVARAAIDAARCPVGDRATSGQCRGATEPRARDLVKHPVAGKTGTSDNGRTASLVITTKGLAVAGILADPDWPETTQKMSHDIVNPAVYETLADGMKGRPEQPFSKPSGKLVQGQQRAIPDVKCKPVAVATAAIRRAGFVVEVDRTPVPSPCPANTVALAQPKGRNTVGGVVILKISNGRPAP